MRVESLNHLLEAAREQGIPALQAAVVHRGALHHRSAHGARHPAGPPLGHRSRMDAASLTKVLATTSVAMVLVDQEQLDLDAPVRSVLPSFRHAQITPRMLLGHRSGLAAWAPLFEVARQDSVASTLYPGVPGLRAFGWSTELMRHAVLSQDPVSAPGPRVYSDIGFLTLGLLLEVVGGAPLDQLARDLVFKPLDLMDTGYVRMEGNRVPEGPFVCTGQERPRPPAPGQEALYSRLEQQPSLRAGEVDDDNAYAMGGVAGHAGVFSTATDVARFGQAILEERRGARRLARPEIVAEFLAIDAPESLPQRSLGWDRPAGTGSTAGSELGQGPLGAVGHLGFTGCSLWIDLDRELVAALLTNRVFPSRTSTAGIRALRPAFHDAVVVSLPA
ncbi:MAG: serine hydrolase domain-containing protein [Myxococcota bacterium]|nr:serine hydrolase domain-containing protein [Myxococcota bacterium]